MLAFSRNSLGAIKYFYSILLITTASGCYNESFSSTNIEDPSEKETASFTIDLSEGGRVFYTNDAALLKSENVICVSPDIETNRCRIDQKSIRLDELASTIDDMISGGRYDSIGTSSPKGGDADNFLDHYRSELDRISREQGLKMLILLIPSEIER